MEKTEQKWICGFWRRIGALVIDTVILATVGYMLGLLLERTFVEMGAWARLVGFFVALIYFGVMNSALAGGQTLGKQLLNLRVVNSSNEPISLARAMARYVVLALPFFVGDIDLENSSLFSYLIYPLAFIAFGGALSTFYLYLFNTRTRQSLHDLVVGSYVVNTVASRQDIEPVWKPHFIAATVLVIAATAIVSTVAIKANQSEMFNAWLTINQELHAMPSVTHSSMSYGPKEVNVDVFLSENRAMDHELAKELAKLMLSSFPELRDKDLLQLNLIYGYNIGIWSETNITTYKFDLTKLFNAGKKSA